MQLFIRHDRRQSRPSPLPKAWYCPDQACIESSLKLQPSQQTAKRDGGNLSRSDMAAVTIPSHKVLQVLWTKSPPVDSSFGKQ